MIFASRQKVIKFLIFMCVVFTYLIIFALLSPIIVFRPTAREREKPSFQLVKIALPPPHVQPPRPSQMILPPLPAGGGSGSTKTIPLPIFTPTKAVFDLPPPKMPSEDEMLAKLSSVNFGRGDSTNGKGSGTGDESGKEQDITDPSQDQHTVTAHPKKMGSTLIFAYIGDGNIEGAKEWLDDGNDPNVPNPHDDYICWPVDWAIIANQSEILKVLLKQGANPDPPNRKDEQWFRTVYLAGIVHRSPEMLKMVLDYGAKPDPIPPQFNSNSVHEVVDDSPNNQHDGIYSKEKQAEILKLLLEHGADPLWKDNHGENALSSAQHQHRQDLVSVIEEYLKQSHSKN